MRGNELYLGIDVGSVSINIVLIDKKYKLIEKAYLRTQGKPIEILKEGLKDFANLLPEGVRIAGVGATGSGRELAGAIVGCDVVKNEITAHGTAVLHYIPDAKTILEIGGQDS